MRTVAERHGFRVLACAPRDNFCLSDPHFFWFQAGPFVRSIAKRLALGTSASAPPINARFDFLNYGPSLSDDRFSHGFPGVPSNGFCRLKKCENVRLAKLRKRHEAQASLGLLGKIRKHHRHMITSVLVSRAGNNDTSAVNFTIAARGLQRQCHLCPRSKTGYTAKLDAAFVNDDRVGG